MTQGQRRTFARMVLTGLGLIAVGAFVYFGGLFSAGVLVLSVVALAVFAWTMAILIEWALL